jgi:hypothetical protein
MKISKEISGIFLAVAGLLLVQFGFSESCSGEIMSKAGPLLGAAPGLLLAYFARWSKGDVTALGRKI